MILDVVANKKMTRKEYKITQFEKRRNITEFVDDMII
jgi:hypothetical protein